MKDRFEAKLILFIIPALAIWEVLYQLVIIRLIPAAKNDTVHGVGFVVLVAAAWLIYRKKAEVIDRKAYSIRYNYPFYPTF